MKEYDAIRIGGVSFAEIGLNGPVTAFVSESFEFFILPSFSSESRSGPDVEWHFWQTLLQVG